MWEAPRRASRLLDGHGTVENKKPRASTDGGHALFTWQVLGLIYSYFLPRHPKRLGGAVTLRRVRWLVLLSGLMRRVRADVYQSLLVAGGHKSERPTLLISLWPL